MADWSQLFGGTYGGVFERLNGVVRRGSEFSRRGDAADRSNQVHSKIIRNDQQSEIDHEANLANRDQNLNRSVEQEAHLFLPVRPSRQSWTGMCQRFAAQALPPWSNLRESLLSCRRAHLTTCMVNLIVPGCTTNKLRFVKALRNGAWKQCPGSEQSNIVKQFARTLACQATFYCKIHVGEHNPELALEMLLLLSEIVTAAEQHIASIGPAVWPGLMRLLGSDTGDTVISCLAIETMQKIAENASANTREQLRNDSNLFQQIWALVNRVIDDQNKSYLRRILLAASLCLVELYS